MADERGYERRVTTGGPAQAVLATPDAYGAGVGAAIADLGGELHQRNLRAYKAWRGEEAERESADAAVRFAALRHRGDDRARELEKTTVGGAGYAEGMAEFLDSEVPTLLDGIKEDSVRRRIEVQAAEYSQTALSRAEQFAAVRGAEHAVDQTRKSWDLSVNRIRTQRGDPATFGQEYAFQLAELRANPNISEDMRVALESQMGAMLQGEQLRSFGKDDPETVKAILASGAMDAVLSPQDRADIDREMELTIRAREQERAEAQQDARDAAREKLKILKGRMGRLETVSQKEAEAVFAEAAAAGVPQSELEADRAAYYDSRRLEAYSPENDPNGDRAARRVAQLDLKRESGQAFTAEERRDYAALQGAANARAREVAAARKDLYQSGPAGAAQAIEEVAALGDRDRRLVAGQELGDNAGYIALLPSPASRKVAIDGKAILKSRPTDFGEAKQVDKAFALAIGAAGPALGAAYGDMKALSWQIYAGQMNARGLAGWDDANYQRALRTAFGMTQRANGTLQGGLATVRERPVLLPDDRTADEFDIFLSRIPAEAYATGVYADGRPARKADVLARYRPEFKGYDASGNTIYHLIGPDSSPLRLKDGKAFPVRVPPMPR